MEIRLAQGETWYPELQEATDRTTAVAVGLRRFSDGHWYDWNDSTFKASGWTTKHQALAEDDNGLWTYDAGFAMPASNAVYVAQFKIIAVDTYYEEAMVIRVNSSYLDILADLVNGGRLDLLIDAIKAKTDVQPEGFKKNTAYNNFMFFMVLSSDHISPATGKNITCQRSIDGAAFANCANSESEIANGAYKINLATTDLNGSTFVTFKFTEADCDQRTITIKLVN